MANDATQQIRRLTRRRITLGRQRTTAKNQLKLDGLIRYLQGNGRPGVIDELRDEDSRQDDRMDRIESRATWLTGIWIGSSSVFVLFFEVAKVWLHR